MMTAEQPRAPIGANVHLDLTVPNAEEVRDFYAAVAGWRAEPLDMGGYSDFVMLAGDGTTPVAGICHARGENAALPPQWIAYITVADLDASLARCQTGGGAIVAGPKGEAPHRYCLIRDPAGAVVALMEQG
jgi:predicted enzyme related to lactoylglutathione lyase